MTTTTASIDEAAARAAAAVAERRAAGGPLGAFDRLLRFDGEELLDRADTPAGVKLQILADVHRITRILQLDRLWIWRIGQLIEAARALRGGKPVRVLDVGAGAGTLLYAIEAWARRKRIPVELHGLDYSAEAVDDAKRHAAAEGHRVAFRHGDARAISHVEDRGVDVAVTTFMLHHLPPADVAKVLAELDRVSASSWYAFDLRRSAVALPPLWALMHLGRFEAPSRHDSYASVRRGYTATEIRLLLAETRVSASVRALPPSFWEAMR